jgi:thiamine pyrophosphokinase
MKKHRAIILCDGEPPSKNLITEEMNNSDLFIVTDGGAYTVLKYNLAPDIIIGDMDSFTDSDDHSFTVIKDIDQETNDLEKALNFALKQECTDVIVLGASGQRVDHTLKNISVLKQFTPKFMSIAFRDSYGLLFLLPKKYTVYQPVGTVISLFPLSGKVEGIKTTGLKYPLDYETLENGVRDGSSNTIAQYPAEISYERGDLLIFIGDNSDI